MKDIKVGDTVVCVHAEGIEHALTNGRRYTVEGIKSKETNVSIKSFFIAIDNDNGLKIDYSVGRFKTLEEIREEKISELGIE